MPRPRAQPFAALSQGCCRDVISNSNMEPERPDIFIVGFECDQYSQLNIHSASSAGAYEADEGKSGKTGRSVVRFITK
eukprot:8863389-Pyramimonas_sp.AAC.1